MSSDHSQPYGRYLKASEVGTYLFCHRAWQFERDRTPSSREPERQAGTAYHVKHGERVAASAKVGTATRIILVVAIVLLLLGLLATFK